jgi:dimethylargininase
LELIALNEGRSFRFTKAITRRPSQSVTGGIRDGAGPDPDAVKFADQHATYVSALSESGAEIFELPELEEFPDSVFVEDTCICLKDTAIILRPGATSRFGETVHMTSVLQRHFNNVIELSGGGFIDGGDVLLSDTDAFIGLSERTDPKGFDALATILKPFDYTPVQVNTPPGILHFKTECGLLDSNTIFATSVMASLACFADYRVIVVPEGEEAAANVVRFADTVFLSDGYPKSEFLLRENGYNVVVLDTSEAAKIDGGLSCMSLRF